MKFKTTTFCCLILWMKVLIFSSVNLVVIVNGSTDDLSNSTRPVSGQQKFEIDYEKNTFLKDGLPFRYISGSFHYFRSVREHWKDIFRKMKLAGLNTIQTYIEWSSHQPNSNENYNFDGNLNIFDFFKLAQEEDLLVIVRPGPFIDAERDMGGLPAWLLWQKQNMTLRSSDLDYNYFVSRWFDYLLPRLVPYLYSNGGPIIMVQVENEYGSYGCDKNYTLFLRGILRRHLGSEVILFTTDGVGESYLRCGSIPDVYPTVDFGPMDDIDSIIQAFDVQRKFAPKGPLVNSEFYPGWLDHWQKPHSKVPVNKVKNSLFTILRLGASVNIYVFYGGTSFGYSAGANLDNGMFDACPTTYDYDAPLTEARDPTEKFFKIKEMIAWYTPVPSENPVVSPKGKYGPVELKPFSYLLNKESLQIAAEFAPVSSLFPLSFEEVKVSSGFVLYETEVNFLTSDPVLLSAEGLKDRAYVYTDEVFTGILSRTEMIMSLSIYIKNGSKLHLLVENQGRLSYGDQIGESKGLGRTVTLGGRQLLNWKMYRLGKLNAELLVKSAQKLFSKPTNGNVTLEYSRLPLTSTGSGIFYYGNLTLDSINNGTILDTFVRFDKWTKGIIWVNNVNLGKYWPVIGPQKTLYLPGPLLKLPPESNTFLVFELESAPDDCIPTARLNYFNNCNIYLTDTHEIDAETPYMDNKIPDTTPENQEDL